MSLKTRTPQKIQKAWMGAITEPERHRSSRERKALMRASLALALIASSIPAIAATYRVPSDDALIRKAGSIVRGEVVDATSMVGEGGGIHTDITIAVDETLKGAVPGPTIVVRQPGGRVGDRSEVYPGIGSFALGTQVLLMLTPIEGGRFRVTDFALGNFRVRRTEDGRTFLRREGLRGAALIDAAGSSSASLSSGSSTPDGHDPAQHEEMESSDPDRDALSFETYVKTVALGRPAAVDYLLPEQAEAGADRLAEFVFLGSPPARRDEFESGTTITYRDNANGDPGTYCQPGGCHAQVSAGMLKWNAVSGAVIHLAYGGTDGTIGNKCLSALDNQIQFNDPCNEIDNLDQNCSGVLAIGGFSLSATSGGSPPCPAMGAPVFQKITSAKIMVNNGTGSCLNACNYTEMIAHETGHTIGAGHTPVNGALMQAILNVGLGLCGIPRSDDEAFAQCVYPQTLMTCGFHASKTWTGPAPIGVAFTSNVSGGLAPFTYDYDFGDGTSDSSTAPTHVYSTPGTFTAGLVVTDSQARTCTAETSITVNPCSPPSARSVVIRQGTSLLKAVVAGSGFAKGSVVQIDSGGGFVSVPVTIRKSGSKLVAKDVAALWPIATNVTVRVLGPSPALCPSNPLSAIR